MDTTVIYFAYRFTGRNYEELLCINRNTKPVSQEVTGMIYQTFAQANAAMSKKNACGYIGR